MPGCASLCAGSILCSLVCLELWLLHLQVALQLLACVAVSQGLHCNKRHCREYQHTGNVSPGGLHSQGGVCMAPSHALVDMALF